ncbi:DUSP9 [Symbiodinium necroappetens]|uniref:DUSP9 protein n=1 Tax=Symbiodinium necroappetens TaxID=1628268 RepID=A0A812N6K9_9DINO|nr:DUSP9 [Symbiodinium necroappetens]
MQMMMREIGKIQQHLNLDYVPLACEATPRSILESEASVEHVRSPSKAVAFEEPLQVDIDEDPTSDVPESPTGDAMTRAHVANKVKKLKRVREMASQTEDSYRDTGCQTASLVKEFPHMLCRNAIWISIDIDYNDSILLINADTVFQVVEHTFCTYFFFEISIRA